MTTIIVATYEGAASVRIDDRLFDYRFKGKDPAKNKGDGYGGVMPRAARALIAEGADPRMKVHLVRNGTSVFTEDRSLGDWAGLHYIEPDKARHSIEAVDYRPFDATRLNGSAKGSRPRGIEAPPSSEGIRLPEAA